MSGMNPVTFEVLQFEDRFGNKYDHEAWSDYVHDQLIDTVDVPPGFGNPFGRC